ncbi:hypothetical protein VTH82DRAFT_6121 [Thermothelomyces myriococcoides]
MAAPPMMMPGASQPGPMMMAKRDDGERSGISCGAGGQGLEKGEGKGRAEGPEVQADDERTDHHHDVSDYGDVQSGSFSAWYPAEYG